MPVDVQDMYVICYIHNKLHKNKVIIRVYQSLLFCNGILYKCIPNIGISSICDVHLHHSVPSKYSRWMSSAEDESSSLCYFLKLLLAFQATIAIFCWFWVLITIQYNRPIIVNTAVITHGWYVNSCKIGCGGAGVRCCKKN